MCFDFPPKGQLWPVLAILATKTGNGGTDQDKDTIQEHKEGNEEVGFASAFWEVRYVQALQLSISSLKGAFNLQCKFEARWIKVQKMNIYLICSLFFTFSYIFLERFSESKIHFTRGWCDGSLHFCISCTCGSSDRHAVLHVAGAPEARIRHQCWAAGTAIDDSLFFIVFFSAGFGILNNLSGLIVFL